jgi:hypothetical protein
VSYLTWNDVAEWLAPDCSSLEAYVLDANETDWQRAIDLVRSRGWRFDYTLEERSLPLPQQVAEIFARTSEAIVTMRIWPAPDLRVNTHFLSEDAVEFDFDRDDLQGQHQLDLLCGFMRALGRHLGKPVRLTPEGSPQHPLIIYSPTEDRFTATA